MQLPMSATGKFPELFGHLEHDAERLGIETYGVLLCCFDLPPVAHVHSFSRSEMQGFRSPHLKRCS